MLKPGLDYEIDRAGRWVFTTAYLRRRGYCCFQGCRHYPWGLAGLGPRAAGEVLRDRLEVLQARATAAALSLSLRDHHDGVLRLHPRPTQDFVPTPEYRACASVTLQQLARGLLTLRAVAWPGQTLVPLDPADSLKA